MTLVRILVDERDAQVGPDGLTPCIRLTPYPYTGTPPRTLLSALVDVYGLLDPKDTLP